VAIERMQNFSSLLEAPSPAVLTTYRKDGTAATSPVWFRFHAGCFEVVVAENDVKLRHRPLSRDARWSCSRPCLRSGAYASMTSRP
jgi:hypothetical protein